MGVLAQLQGSFSLISDAIVSLYHIWFLVSLYHISCLVSSVLNLQLRWASSTPKPATPYCRSQRQSTKPVLQYGLVCCRHTLVLPWFPLSASSSNKSPSVELHVALMSLPTGSASVARQPGPNSHLERASPKFFLTDFFSTEISILCCVGPLWGCLMLGHLGGGGRRG